ncbi:MAG TPA: hypothetical protein VFF79_04440 [Conexibacter sp.]|jgi:hypothetical protein|nr:hypothetical protein [Conexibacter sp.]
MSAGTTIVLTLGPAAITGLVGYAVARTHVGITEVQVAAERDRLRTEHAEAARQSRQAAYHAFLTLLYRLDMLVSGFGSEDFSDAVFKHWADEFLQLCGGIGLSSEPPVRAALHDVRNVIDAIGLAAVSTHDHRPFAESFAAAYRAQRGALDGSMSALLTAMQVDVELTHV